MRKILYSPGYGAGWSTWHYNVPKEFSTQYQPIIDALLRGETLTEFHPAVQQYVKECKEKFDYAPYLGGLEDLRVYTCDDNVKVRIHEYDGSESVHTNYDEEYF